MFSRPATEARACKALQRAYWWSALKLPAWVTSGTVCHCLSQDPVHYHVRVCHWPCPAAVAGSTARVVISAKLTVAPMTFIITGEAAGRLPNRGQQVTCHHQRWQVWLVCPNCIKESFAKMILVTVAFHKAKLAVVLSAREPCVCIGSQACLPGTVCAAMAAAELLQVAGAAGCCLQALGQGQQPVMSLDRPCAARGCVGSFL